MKQLLQTSWKTTLSLLFGVAALIFWGNYYPAHLSFQEQYQLFLFDTDYWWERVAIPGGLADYIAEFLTQFYYYSWAGAFLLASLYVALQRMVWLLAKKQVASDVYYPLSFLPVIALWHYMSDENAMLGFGIALLMTLITIYGYTKLQGKWGRIGYVVVILPLLYWTAGATHFIFMGWVIITEIINCFKRRYYFTAFSVLFGVGILGLLSPLLAQLVVQYPLYRLMGGINYYRFPAIIPFIEIVTAVLFLTIPFIIANLPPLKKRRIPFGILQVLVIAFAGYFFISLGCDMNKEEVMEYDQLARHQQWVRIIRKAERIVPTSPFTMTCLNLALGKTGQLGDRMFAFQQNGVEGLFPQFQRDFISQLPSAEVYYHLGMINTAQRYTFESMEAIPNYRKSGRLYKRLAETNMINGAYDVAAKYLRALKKTMFYRAWAEEAMTYLYNDAKVDAHKEWGQLKKLRYTKDFLFSDHETDMMLGLLYEENYQNRMAFEYLMAYVLLQRDVERFMRYYPLGKHAGYTHIPRSYQETLIYTWMQTHNSFQGLPWSISKEVLQDVTEFARFMASPTNNRQAMQARFGNTYWFYLLSKK